MRVRYRPTRRGLPRWLAVAATVSLLGTGVATQLEAAVCGPFTDVDDSDFCPSILAVYYLGLTAGTSPTTFGPTLPVTRQVLAAMLARAARGVSAGSDSRRAALDQFWTTKNLSAIWVGIGSTEVGASPVSCKSDGTDIWTANVAGHTVSRVRASDGGLLETWTAAVSATGVLSAMGVILVTGATTPGALYAFVPSSGPTSVVTVSNTLGGGAGAIAFDGNVIWTANPSSGSVSSVLPGSSFPWPTFTVTGYGTPTGILYDGTSVWVTDNAGGRLLKLNGHAIDQIVMVGTNPRYPTFDGTNIWVPNNGSNSVSVVRASSGTVLTTLTDNGLDGPTAAAFDGQRVLVTNAAGESVSVWRASDLAPLGATATGAGTVPFGACSDGINFWVTLPGSDLLVRF